MAITTKAALADELGISRARVSQYVKVGLPVRSDGRLNRDEALNWIKRTQVGHIGSDKGANRAQRLAGQDEKRSKPAGVRGTGAEQDGFDPRWPKAYITNCGKTNFLGGLCVMSVMRMVYDTPAIAATMAVHAGASAATAYRMRELLTVALMGQAQEVLQSMNVQPFASGEELDWALDRFQRNDWSRLASVAGEPHDEAAWHSAMITANAEQFGGAA